jgi:predicted NodU family carbamoyl transferase
MNILGISAGFHDAAATVLQDGNILFAGLARRRGSNGVASHHAHHSIKRARTMIANIGPIPRASSMHFTHRPATIADLYDPESMPDNLRAAHERNDETLERIYLGRRFKNDTERLEKLFSLYTEMTAKQGVVLKKPVTRKTKATPA